MSAELVILVSTAVLAVVALSAATVAVRAVRTLRQTPPQAPASTELALVERAVSTAPQPPAALAPRVVGGRLIVPPTQQQVVATALGRPGIRMSVFTHGIAHALRPESRDRILGMMRREYRRRRRERLAAGRRATRSATPSPSADSWLGS